MESLVIDVTVQSEASVQAQAIALDVAFEDEHLLVINKPAGLVVHPAAGHADGTLQNALLHHAPGIEAVPRAGIVHRLDKLTSGIMVAAKTLQAHKSLVDQLQQRTMKREYQALVHGQIIAGGTIDEPIGRHPKDRTRMAVVAGGKSAVTHFRVARKFTDFTLLDVSLETGRTHQIRVHMAHQRLPLVGDPVYGIRFRPPAGAGQPLLDQLQQFRRQALHARRLTLTHPNGESMAFEAPLPTDLQQLLAALSDDTSQERG